MQLSVIEIENTHIEKEFTPSEIEVPQSKVWLHVNEVRFLQKKTYIRIKKTGSHFVFNLYT